MARKRNKNIRCTDEEYSVFRTYMDTGVFSADKSAISDVNIIKIKSEKEKVGKKYKELVTYVEQLQDKVDFYESFSNGNIAKHKIKPRKKGGHSRSVAFGILSDVHVEERIDPDTINGKNEYTPDIAKARIENFFRNLAYMTDGCRNRTEIKTLVLALLGDFISGYIHDELVESNWMSPTEAILFIYDLLCAGIRYLEKHGKFENIVIPCAFGNHARTTQKKHISTAYKNNLEWMMYNMMAREFKDSKNIEFVVSKGFCTYFDAFNGKYRIRFHHGDLVQHSSAIGGISTSANKTIAKWERAEDEKIYLDVFGHHHGFQDGGDYIVNGSLSGYNAFGFSIKATYEEPKQAFFLVEETKGKTIVAPIFVTEAHA